jgi:uncharacterized protein
VFDYILIKLASRCNLDCSYCYWFRDPAVRDLPALLDERTFEAFLGRLRHHLERYEIRSFVCSFHGGEPLLIGTRRFESILRRIDHVGDETKCSISYAITTNGVLIDDGWTRLLSEFAVAVTVSIDGPEHVHDASRVTIHRKGSWQSAVRGYLSLCEVGISPSIIAVCNPVTDAEEVLDFLAGNLGAVLIDVLVPDANFETAGRYPIDTYYIKLFDVWYDRYWRGGVEVRILHQMVRGIMGLQSTCDKIGFGPTQTVCLNTDGRLEANDVLRIAGASHVRTSVDVFESELDAILTDPLWTGIQRESVELVEECMKCKYQRSCGGGHLSQRWSIARGYRNVSVYCADYMSILAHITKRITPEIEALLQPTSRHKLDVSRDLANGQGLTRTFG